MVRTSRRRNRPSLASWLLSSRCQKNWFYTHDSSDKMVAGTTLCGLAESRCEQGSKISKPDRAGLSVKASLERAFIETLFAWSAPGNTMGSVFTMKR
jgi:hypothetical protein